jgi:molecular chaperone DnaK
MTDPRYVLGIDLGTTNTVCAAWKDEPRAEPFVCHIRQPFGGPDAIEPLPALSSVVAFTEADGVLVGHYAKDEFARAQQERTVSSVKRHMGTRWTKTIDGRVWHPEQVSGCILRAVRDGLTDLPAGEPAWVVITVPACFGTEQRRATLDAARLAGFDPKTTRLFDEPAAALLHQSWVDTAGWEEEKRLLILDVGGGTLDASYMVVRRDGDTLLADLQGRSRYNELGGDDIDLNLAGLLLPRVAEEAKIDLDRLTEGEHRTLCWNLLRVAEDAKKKLCDGLKDGRVPDVEKHPPANMKLSGVPGRTTPFPLAVKLKELLVALAEFMPRSADDDKYHYSFTEAITQALDTADRVSADHPPKVDLVYLTGGSSRLPVLRDAVLYHPALRGKKVPVTPVAEPMDAVALGAARYAGTLAQFQEGRVVLTERMFEGIYLRTDAGAPRPLIPPMTDITADTVEVTHTFETSGPGTRAEIDLFTGSGDGDAEMRPIRKRSLSFPEVLPPGHLVHFTATVTPNRQVGLSCWTELNGRRVPGAVEVRAERAGRPGGDGEVVQQGLKWVREDDCGDPLPAVNPLVKPASGGGES